MSLKAMNRRTFLETATTVTGATLLTSGFGWAAAEHKAEHIAVQLYSVRDAMKEDFDGTLAKVAKVGYKEVEFAGYFGRTAQQVKASLEKVGLTAPSTHAPGFPKNCVSHPTSGNRLRKNSIIAESRPRRRASSSPITITGSSFYRSMASFPTTNF